MIDIKMKSYKYYKEINTNYKRDRYKIKKRDMDGWLRLVGVGTGVLIKRKKTTLMESGGDYGKQRTNL